MPYNTGNPIPSSDAKDLSDNAENLDNSVNTALDTWTDRLGVVRRTIQGQLKLLGYTAPDVYTGGLVFTVADNMATIDRNGTIYAPKPSAIPFTTSGTWTADDEDKFFVVQGVTTENLNEALEESDVVVLAADTVADMKTKDLQPGQFIRTKANNTTSNAGGAKYLIQTAAEYGGTPDGYGDHALDNGNVAVLQTVDGAVTIRQMGAQGNETTSADTITYKTTDISVNRWSTNQDVGPIIVAASLRYKKLIVEEGNYYLNGVQNIDALGFTIEGVNSGSCKFISGNLLFSNTSKFVTVRNIGFYGDVEKYSPPLPITFDPLLENDPAYIWYLDSNELGWAFEAVSIAPATSATDFAESFLVDNCYFEMRQNAFLASSATEDRPAKTKDLKMVNCTCDGVWFWGFGGRYCSQVIVANNVFMNSWSGGCCDSSSGCEYVLFDSNVSYKNTIAFKSESRDTDFSINLHSMFTNNIIISPDDTDNNAVGGQGLGRSTGRGTKISGNTFINTNANGYYFIQDASIYNEISDNLFINAGSGETEGVIELFVDIFISQTEATTRVYNNRYVKAQSATGAITSSFVNMTERGSGVPQTFGKVIIKDNTIDECLTVVRGTGLNTSVHSISECTISGNKIDYCYRLFAATLNIGLLNAINNEGRMLSNGISAESNAYVDIGTSRVTGEVNVLNNALLFHSAFTPSSALPTKLLEIGGGAVNFSGAKVRVNNNTVEFSQVFVWCSPTNASQFPAEIYINGNNIEQRATTTLQQQIMIQNRPGGTMVGLVKDNRINALSQDFSIVIDPATQNSVNNILGLGTINTNSGT